MKILIENSISKLVIGGPDHLVDPKLMKNIRDYLSVDVPGAYHVQAYKKHLWDGKRYFCTPMGKVPTGMLPVLLGFLEDEYTNLEVEESPIIINNSAESEGWICKICDNF